MTPAQRRSILLVSALAVVLLAEAGARVLSPYLDEPDAWGDRARAVKVAQLDDRAATGGCVDVVVAGNSMARDGIVPSIMMASDPEGRSVYNAALDAAGPALVEPWLVDHVLPRVEPATVLLVVATPDLNPSAPASRAAADNYRSSLAGSPGAFGAVHRWLTDHVALVRTRAMLRSPDAIDDAIDRWRRDEPAPRTAPDTLSNVLGSDGEGRSRSDLLRQPGAPVSAFVTEQLLADFTVAPEATETLAALAVAVRARGAEPAFVILPVTDAFVDAHPNGQADLDATRAAVAAAASGADAPLVDLSDAAVPDDGFADSHHLNAVGARAVSEALPAALERAGVPVRHCRP